IKCRPPSATTSRMLALRLSLCCVAFSWCFADTVPKVAIVAYPLKATARLRRDSTVDNANSSISSTAPPDHAINEIDGGLSPARHEAVQSHESKRLSLDTARGGSKGLLARHSTPLDHTWANPEKCFRHATCEPIINATCFGVSLPYSHTTVELVNDSTSQLEIQERLNLWQGLQQIPRCWAVVQPLLCAVYRPKCVDGRVTLPSQEMCRLVRGFCKVVALGSEWPSFLQCQHDIFTSGCKNEMREIKFNTSGRCADPLVATPRETSWYTEVEGCGIGCRHPLLTEDERLGMRTFVVVVSSIATVTSLFAVLTFMIGWKESRQYPNVMVFYINLCLLLMCVGWLAQFIPGAREDITCRRDGTLRSGEPSSGENLSCVVIFCLVYYFLMAALCWFVMLTYAWDNRFQARGSVPRESLDAKSAYFHLIAWCVPFVLTITVMALGKANDDTCVDGDPVSGICFVTSTNPIVRSAFVLLPVTVAFFVGGYFLVREFYKLITLKVSNSDMLNDRVRTKIQSMILRIGLFVVTMVLLVSCTFVCHIYEFKNQAVWTDSLRSYVACRANVAAAQRFLPEGPQSCDPGSRPSLAMLQLHLVAFLGACIALSSWVLTAATAATWKRFWCRTILRRPLDEPVKLQRHKLIAEAFARRNELNRGQGSVSFHSAHDDPVGMNLDVNSVTSQDLSSTWATALPSFLQRRGAVAGPGALPVRRYSSTSDVSRQISMSVRRQSLDSQASYHQLAAEKQWLRHQRRKTRRERERLVGPCQSPFPILPMRRGSDSSAQSLAATLQGMRPRAPFASKAALVARATSTGDLNPGSVIPQNYLSLNRPLVGGQHKRDKVLINPPFTHGMSDTSATRMSMRRGPSNAVAADTALPTSVNAAASTAGASPNDASAASTQGAPINRMPGLMPPYAAMPNPYAAYMGYLGALRMPPTDVLPYGYPPAAFYGGFPFYPPTGMFPYGQGFTSYPDLDPRHTPLIPMHPMPDSMSESGFVPIITSDSEFTDLGVRSPELLSARLAVEERQRIVAELAAMSPRPQTNQETQTERGAEAAPTPTLRATPLSKASPTKAAAVEAIEMREIKSGQSRQSNVSAASKARLSKSPPVQQTSRASKSNTPMNRFSSVSPPSGSPVILTPQAVQQTTLQAQSVSPRCHGAYQPLPSHSLNNNVHNNNSHPLSDLNDPQCSSAAAAVECGDLWQSQQAQRCSCQCSAFDQDFGAQSATVHSYPLPNEYLQGALSPSHFQQHTCPASGSTEPNTIDSMSCPSNSDGPHSCHTYLFAPVPSPMDAEGMDHQGFPTNGFVQLTEQYPGVQQLAMQQGHPAFGGCCEGPPQPHIGHNSPQGLTDHGFVSR
ncbi:unnamed protein product, partial [Ixodes hexagonus]